MKLRLRAEIEKARAARPRPTHEQRSGSTRALAELEVARIGTIHAFCADLLRERPVEARVDPLFEVAAEDERERLFDEAFERWFQAASPIRREGVRRILRRRARDRDAQGPRTCCARGLGLVEQRDFDAPWRRDRSIATAIDRRVVERLRDARRRFAAKADAKDDYLVKNLVDIASLRRRARRARKRCADARPRRARGRAARSHQAQTWQELELEGQLARLRADGALRNEVARTARRGSSEDLDARCSSRRRRPRGAVCDASCVAARRRRTRS